jgi:hypothetical protein
MATTDTPAAILEGRAEERRSTCGAPTRLPADELRAAPPGPGGGAPVRPRVGGDRRAQRIKNWATKSSLSVKTLSPEWRLVLTGTKTPMENRLEELASVLDWSTTSR